MSVIAKARKGLSIFYHRIRYQGLGVTLAWAIGRGVPKLTGVPLLRYSRITPTVYVGPQFNQRGKRALEKEGIVGDINMRIEFDDAAHGLALAEYCYLPTIDDAAPTMAHLLEGAAFAERVIGNGGKVYIHCAGGIGRAPTMAAAYFMSQGMSLDEALALIKKTRPFINIMPPQMARLRDVEAHFANQTDG
ncbi:MAG: dual specificity protein phosphatase family protein [Anaerolineae bacterium]|nr:dual specificity protein phosphatase family protein [Anaerolineae bacterium]MCO5191730.1 dual specificity protein phosphatase family protein [Anaerolineae bacterium]MCO5206295.1 dual specificity protein phosphatase family protein [Anaerolineae bacterium]